MTVELSSALDSVRDAAARIFDADPAVRSVGVAASVDGYGFAAVRNTQAIVPFRAVVGAGPAPTRIDGIPVEYVNSYRDPSNLSKVPHSGPASPSLGSLIPERQSHLPLVCGLQIQNFDDDLRTGLLGTGLMTVGTLGCFVLTNDGNIAILSNNHVLAGENRGKVRQDRIQQAGGPVFNAVEQCADLDDFIALLPSPARASLAAGTVVLNDVDAATGLLVPARAYSQQYLPMRNVAPPRGAAAASVGDRVHKVGRTTDLTFGTVKQIGVVVGPVSYDPGPCWFELSIVIEGINGTTFSDHGDSGAAIVRDDGMVVGLLYAGNGTQTYACPIGNVLSRLNCRLA